MQFRFAFDRIEDGIMEFRLEEARKKLEHFCAYQERSFYEAEQKLKGLGLNTEEAGEVILELSRQGFLDEERFARAYVRGKFRIKRWGRKRIVQGLKQHHVSDFCIRKGLEEIDGAEYELVLQEAAEAKWKSLKSEKNVWNRQKKTGSFLLSRGFEPDLYFPVLRQLAEV